MKIRLILFISALILIKSDFAVAETISFQNHNFTIEVPPTWTTINPTSPGALFAVQSSDGEKVFFANALSVPENERASRGLSRMIAGFKKARIDNNCQIVAERQQTTNDLSFIVITSQALGKNEATTTGLPLRAPNFTCSKAFIKLVMQTLTRNCYLLSAVSISFHPLKPLATITQPLQRLFALAASLAS